jgi:hypothetical protein
MGGNGSKPQEKANITGVNDAVEREKNESRKLSESENK